MSSIQLDDSLKRFIAQHIASVEQLEILLLLSENPATTWTVEDIFKVIQSNQESIDKRLKLMHKGGLFELNGEAHYFYKPSDSRLAENVLALTSAYKKSPVKIIEAIFSEPTSQAKHFADSFRIKKEK